MKNRVYAISDRLTGRFGHVFDNPTDASAQAYMLNTFGKHPSYKDLSLFAVGEIDIETGIMTAYNDIKNVKLLFPTGEIAEPMINQIEKGNN